MIISSLLDQDLYTLTVNNCVLNFYPNKDIILKYKFKNRGKHRFTKEFLTVLEEEIYNLSTLKLMEDEKAFLKKYCPYLSTWYIDQLENTFKFDPSQVKLSLTKDGDLDAEIEGDVNSIIYEIPKMALISELYFKIIDKDWNYEGQKELINRKMEILAENNCKIIEFGTRRRRSFETQKLVIEEMNKYPNFLGTSNIFFSKQINKSPLGTFSHQLLMLLQVLEEYENCNKVCLEKWAEMFANDGNLSCFLTDVYGVDNFLKHFNYKWANLYKATRHDSGNPFEYGEKLIKHYKDFNIDPMSKIIIFSDSLNLELILKINEYFKDRIQCIFGVGTFLTNHFMKLSNPLILSDALNMIIKLYEVYYNGKWKPTCKIPDGNGKNFGEEKIIEIVKYLI